MTQTTETRPRQIARLLAAFQHEALLMCDMVRKLNMDYQTCYNEVERMHNKGWINDVYIGSRRRYSISDAGLEMFGFNKMDTVKEAWQPAEFNQYTTMREDFESRLEPIKEVPPDNVNQPTHYTQGEVECIDAAKASLSVEGYRGALKFNVQKYVWRYEHKGGVESLKKAQWYLNKLIDTFEEGV